MVSIIIVNWNSGPCLEKCLASLRDFAPGCEVIVVDNASRDGSLDFIESQSLSVVLLRNDRNAGFAAACNQGWHAAKGDLILFLNPDTECRPRGVESLAQRIESDQEISAAGGLLMDSGGAVEAGFNVRAFPTIGAVAAEMLLFDEIWPRNPWTRRYRMADCDHNSACDVDQPAAACLMVRRATLECLGGFDEQFWPAWFEDVDLCKRIRQMGGRIVFEPTAHFRHHGSVSLRTLKLEEFLRYYHGNQIRYFEKHHGRAAAKRVRSLVIAGLYARAAFAAVGVRIQGSAEVSQARTCWRVARHLARLHEARA